MSTNYVSTTEDWIGTGEDSKLVSYDLRSISDDTSTSTSLVFTQADFEFHSAHRTLAEKARGQMSDFEREYPW
jgi:hypothetical protein